MVSSSPKPIESTFFFAGEAPIALLCYCLSSIMMTLTNKYVLGQHHFNLNLFLLAIQSIVCVGFLKLCKSIHLLKYRELNHQDSKTWLPVSLLLILMIYTGSKSIQYLTVSMFTVFKNMTIVLIALGEQRLFHSHITPLMWVSFGLIIASSLIGGFNDLNFNAQGYLWQMANCISSSAYILYMRLSIKKVGFADFDSVYYNNCLAIPIMLACSFLVEDWHGFFSNYFGNGLLVEQRNALFSGMLISSISAFAISYGTAWSVRVSSSTTYSMVGSLNKLPIALSGLLFFAEERKTANFGNIASVFIAFLSGIIYSWSQVLTRAKAKGIMPIPPQEIKSFQSTQLTKSPTLAQSSYTISTSASNASSKSAILTLDD